MRILCLLGFLFISPFQIIGQDIDSNYLYLVDTIIISNNKTTKDYIILRELSFIEGDTIRHGQIEKTIERSRQNVFNTRLFNFVTISWAQTKPNHITIAVEVNERWYIWPFPVVENADRNFSNWWRNRNFDRLSYGLNLQWHNFRGRNEKLSLIAQFGFEQEFALAYSIPYIDKKRRLGLTFISGYTSNKEVNYGSKNNERLFLKSDTEDLKKAYFFSTYLSVRKKLYRSHNFSLHFNSTQISDSLKEISNEYLIGNNSSANYWSIGYTFNWDTRDNVSYPLKGSQIRFHAFKSGLGITNSKLNILSGRLMINNHYPITKYINYSHAIIGKAYFFNTPPYSHQKGLGFEDFVRGYEFYVLDGQHYALFKNNFKLTLLQPRIKKLNFVPMEKFNTIHYAIYMNLFSDIAYLEDKIMGNQNELSNKMVMGYGIGLDFVTYYDIVIRTEYSFNIENESGFFLHFKKSI